MRNYDPALVATDDNFCNNSNYHVLAELYAEPAAVLTATHNGWGTDDPAEIEQPIARRRKPPSAAREPAQ